MTKAVVDRIEGDYAVVLVEGEDLSRDVPRDLLPLGTGEGDHLEVEILGGEIVTVERDVEATEDAQKRIQAKLERLRRGDHLTGGE